MRISQQAQNYQLAQARAFLKPSLVYILNEIQYLKPTMLNLIPAKHFQILRLMVELKKCTCLMA